MPPISNAAKDDPPQPDPFQVTPAATWAAF